MSPPAPSPVQPCPGERPSRSCSTAEPRQVGYSQQERRHLSNKQKPTHAFISLHALPYLGKKSPAGKASPRHLKLAAPGVAARLPSPAREQSQRALKHTSSLAPPAPARRRGCQEPAPGRRVPASAEREPHPRAVRGHRPPAARERGKEVAPEERFGAGCVPCAGCTAASAQNPSGHEGEAADEGCTGAASWGAAGPATPHLPGHPRQLGQPCGTIIPILQARRDAPAVLVLPEPNVSALPALGDPPWPELPVCSTAGGRQHGAAGSGFGGPHSLWDSLAVFPRGVSLSARQRQC